MEIEKQAIERVKSSTSITEIETEQIALSVKRIAECFAQIANSICKPFLTPRQYHFLLQGKKRVKKKWLNVARKRKGFIKSKKK